jgi:hypothetical protein
MLAPARWSTGFCLAAALACSDSPFEATIENVAGAYSATRLTTTESGVTTNQLTHGATLDLTLAADGSTTGRLFIPGGAEGGGDFDEDLTGTWTLTGKSVTFDHAADTFVRDMPFTAGLDRLSGEATFGDVTVRVTLEK